MTDSVPPAFPLATLQDQMGKIAYKEKSGEVNNGKIRRTWDLACRSQVESRERCRRLSWPTGQGMSGACFVHYRIGPEASDLQKHALSFTSFFCLIRCSITV